MKNKSLFDSALERIEQGKKGLNEGLPMGFPRMVEYIPNIQRGTYYLIGGATGMGKSAFTDEAFLFNPYESILANGNIDDFRVIYYSFEIDKVIKIIKAITRRIYYQYGVLIDVNYVLSRGKNRINDEIYQKVISLRNYFEPLEDIITIFDLSKSPSEIKEYLHNYANSRGKTEYTHWIDNNNKKHREFKKYTPDNPDEYVEIIIDHIALSKEEDGKDTKKIIDSISQTLVPIRNNYRYIPVVIQQLAFDSTSVNRIKSNHKEPMLSDFGDSKYTSRDFI
jgi:hypothetical protein